MVEIIKLSDYLEEHRQQILVSVVEALGMDPEKDVDYLEKALNELAANLSPTEQQKLEEIIEESIDSDDIELIREMLGMNEIVWEEDSMDYVDVAEGYNFRCIMDSDNSRNSFMDWLEESGYEYLIDNDGRFAVKSNTREAQYRIGRKVDHLAGRWDKPISGMNVDPTAKKNALRSTVQKTLEGNVVKGPWGNPTEPERYDYDPNYEYEPAPEPDAAYAFQGMDPETKIEYAYSTLVQRALDGEGGGDLSTAMDVVEAEMGADFSPRVKANLVARFRDEFGDDLAVQQAFKYGTAGSNRLVQSEDAKDSLFKDNTHSSSPFSDETRDDDEDLDDLEERFKTLEGSRNTATKRLRKAQDKLSQMGSPNKGIGAAGLNKNRQKSGPIDTKKGKKGYQAKQERQKVIVTDSQKPVYKMLNMKLYELTRTSLLDMMGTWIDELREQYPNDMAKMRGHMVEFLRKNWKNSRGEAVGDIMINELVLDALQRYEYQAPEAGVTEAVLGNLTCTPPLDRMQQLAGIHSQRPDANITTVTVVPTQDPGTPKITELPGVAAARDLMAKAFGIFDDLPTEQQDTFKKYMIDQLMGNKINESIEIVNEEMLNEAWIDLVYKIDTWHNQSPELRIVEDALILVANTTKKLKRLT